MKCQCGFENANGARFCGDVDCQGRNGCQDSRRSVSKLRCDGRLLVTNVTVIGSLDGKFGLDNEVIKAVRQWKFKPGHGKVSP